MVKHFSNAKTGDMKHVKPTQEQQPGKIIIHVGTNDLPVNQSFLYTRLQECVFFTMSHMCFA